MDDSESPEFGKMTSSDQDTFSTSGLGRLPMLHWNHVFSPNIRKRMGGFDRGYGVNSGTGRSRILNWRNLLLSRGLKRQTYSPSYGYSFTGYNPFAHPFQNWQAQFGEH